MPTTVFPKENRSDDYRKPWMSGYGVSCYPVILDTLSDEISPKAAYDLLFQTRSPSWLYEVEQGATTIWESWITSDEAGNPKEVSLNHYAFGCVDDWMFRNISGISPIDPGYKKFRVEPKMDSRLTAAERTYQSPYGIISVAWKREGESFEMNVTVPCNTKAEIILPNGNRVEYGSGIYAFSCTCNV